MELNADKVGSLDRARTSVTFVVPNCSHLEALTDKKNFSLPRAAIKVMLGPSSAAMLARGRGASAGACFGVQRHRELQRRAWPKTKQRRALGRRERHGMVRLSVGCPTFTAKKEAPKRSEPTIGWHVEKAERG